MPHFKRNQFIPRSIEDLWDFFADPECPKRMNPNIPGFDILSYKPERLQEGRIIKYQIEIFPGMKRKWVNKVTECVEGVHYAEKQVSGPYRYWHHRHEFEARDNGVWMTDRVHFQMKNGIMGRMAYKWCVRNRLEHIFDFRSMYLEQKFGAKPAVKSGSL